MHGTKPSEFRKRLAVRGQGCIYCYRLGLYCKGSWGKVPNLFIHGRELVAGTDYVHTIV